MDSVDDVANKLNLKLCELDKLLTPIMDTCTKDSISNGKAWILQHCNNIAERSDCVANYLLNKWVPFSRILEKVL